MRTSIDIQDELLRLAKRRAADDGVTLKSMVEQALRSALDTKVPRGSRYRLRWKTERGRLQRGVRLDDRDALLDLMDGR